jgi:glycolate oxidase iron-sulfur subunit
VVNAAGCGAALSEYGELLGHEPDAETFGDRIVDVSAFLVREGFERPKGTVDARVAYDEPCHLVHAQKVREEPRRLLSSISGISLIAFPDSERCCGSAGIYNITHHSLSMKALAEKMRHLRDVRPDIIVSGNPGCLIQLSRGALRDGLDSEVTHPIMLLDRAYDAGPPPGHRAP